MNKTSSPTSVISFILGILAVLTIFLLSFMLINSTKENAYLQEQKQELEHDCYDLFCFNEDLEGIIQDLEEDNQALKDSLEELLRESEEKTAYIKKMDEQLRLVKRKNIKIFSVSKDFPRIESIKTYEELEQAKRIFSEASSGGTAELLNYLNSLNEFFFQTKFVSLSYETTPSSYHPYILTKDGTYPTYEKSKDGFAYLTVISNWIITSEVPLS